MTLTAASLHLRRCARTRVLSQTLRVVSPSIAIAVVVLTTGCSSVSLAPVSTSPSASSAPAQQQARRSSSSAPLLPPAGSGRGGYYQDDGPADLIPEGLANTPDAEPKVEPILPRATNRPYVVFGKTYTPITDDRPFKQRGVGSWYGKKFHGQKTSSGEPYDMFKMTAAHPTLPIPSYVRVTHIATGKQVIVRVNDRGPFHSGRVIDLSYTAALKLGYLGRGSGELEVERLLPDEIARINASRLASQTASAQIETGAVAPPQASVVEVAPPPAEVIASASAPAEQPRLAAAGSFYLQFGAYSQQANAEIARQRLASIGSARLPAVEVVRSNELYRIFGGPFSSRVDAEAAAQAVRSAGSGNAVIVQR